MFTDKHMRLNIEQYFRKKFNEHNLNTQHWSCSVFPIENYEYGAKTYALFFGWDKGEILISSIVIDIHTGDILSWESPSIVFRP